MMKISTISFLFGLFLFTTSNAMDINYVQVISSNFDDSSNPWELENLYIGQIIELKEIEFEMDECDLNEISKKIIELIR